MRFHLRQWHVYTILWLWVLLYPVIDRALDSSSSFQWSEIWSIWISFIPFFVLFLLHNLLIHKFPLPRRAKAYLISTIGLLVLFTLFQYLRFESSEFHDIGRFQREYMENDERMPPPKPEEMGNEAMHEPMPPMHEPMDQKFPPKPPKGKLTPAYMMDFIIALLMLGCNLMVVLLFKMQKEHEKVQLLKRTNLQHELKYLKAQLQPHFLMNMLNNIHTMIEIDPEKAQEMIINLSKLMRYTLYEGGKQQVPLSHEALFISNYVVLMEQRCSSKKVSINLSLPEFISDKILIPPLLFIVFIENAFKHGISYSQASFINISLEVTPENRIRFHCENSIPAISEKSSLSGGIGLENVRKRLDLLFGNDYTLDIEPTDTVYNVTLNIPIYDEKHSMPGSR